MRTFWVTVAHGTACVGCTKCGKRCAYVSGSGGVSMYTSNTRHMRVITHAFSLILGCGACSNIRVVVRVS